MSSTLSATSSLFLDLAAKGARFPIGTDLILAEKSDPHAVKLDGRQLGIVIQEAARCWGTPLAVPLMDLTVEKEWLLTGLGVPSAQIGSWHFDAGVPEHLPGNPPTPRLIANTEAIRYIAAETDLIPCGMSIGPFSLMTKLISDPISPVYLAGLGEDDDPDVQRVENTLNLATETVLHTIGAQLDAGARAVIVCEPAANTVYFSPNQMEAGADTFERYVIALNTRVSRLLRERGAALIFHDCGELMPSMLDNIAMLAPAMLSLGSSRALWEDAAHVPKNIVLYGNLPTKKFYSDQVLPLGQVRELTLELLSKMRDTGHPFILGSECDVLSVPGSEKTIRAKVNAMLEP